MFRLCLLLVGVLLPASVLCAPSLNTQFPAPGATDNSNEDHSVTDVPQGGGKPNVVDPIWITVPGPSPSYVPNPKPHVMPPYTGYVVVPPIQQPVPGQWPGHYPSMPVQQYPYPHHGHYLYNQQMGPYRFT